MKKDSIFKLFSVKISIFKVFIPVFFFLICFSTAADQEQVDGLSVATDDPVQTKEDKSFVLPDNGEKPIGIMYLDVLERENLKKQVRAQIQVYIQDILDLCNIHSLPEQISHIEKTLESFRALKDYSDQIRLLTYNDIYYSLFGTYIGVFWKYLNPEQRRVNIADEFLLQYQVMYNLQDGSGPEYLQYDWARDLYTGLFCLTHGYAPPASIASKLEHK